MTKGEKTRSGVAFIHTGAWGDLFVSTAALKSVIDAFPNEQLTIVGSEKWLKIIEPFSWPTIKSILASENGRSGELFTWDEKSGSWTSEKKSISLLKFFVKFRATFNLRTESFRFGLAPLFARVPIRHGSAPLPWSQILYTHRAPWLGKDPIIHERDRMLQVIEAPDCYGALTEKWKLSNGLPPIKRVDRTNAENLAHAKFGRYWLINPTASRREKAWPAEKYRDLFVKLKPLMTKNGLDLRLIGAPLETEWLKEALPRSENFSETVLQAARYSDLFDLVAGSQVLVANTSSLQFVSAGFGVKTITLMGSANPKIWGPLGPADILVRASENQDTGLTAKSDLFAKERDCYSRISVEQVLESCRRFL